MNDIVKHIKNCSYFLYADELALVINGKSVPIMLALMQSDLDTIGSWCYSNRLTVNASKTKAMWCYPMRAPIRLVAGTDDLMLNGSVLSVVKEFNYLGVIIDYDLSFRSQCVKVHSMSNARFTQLCFIKKVIDQKTAISIYKTMILPVFDYADIVIDGGPTLAISRLQTVQNNCLRLCLGIKKTRDISTIDLHILCSAEKLKLRRKKHVLVLMFRRSKVADHVVTPVRLLRNNNKIKLLVHRPILESYRVSPLYRGMLHWQSLDPVVQHSLTISAFKGLI